ncbi:MAG: hypothetical protein AB1814_00820 [Thermodesulfobacteriota bacterium]
MQMAQFVFHSPHVQGNHLYRTRAGETTLIYASADDKVNAFATDQTIPELSIEPPYLVVHGGMTRTARLMALGLGADRRHKSFAARGTLIQTVQGLGVRIVSGAGNLTKEAAKGILAETGLTASLGDEEILCLARSYAAAILMNVVGHELGHIVLGHTLGRAGNFKVSRNQEREADSFAASVIATSPFSDYLVGGSIFFWILLAWVDKTLGPEKETTHPHARERLQAFIKANREEAASLGIDVESVEEFLP